MSHETTTTFPTLFVKYTARNHDAGVKPNLQIYTDDQGQKEWDPKKMPLAASADGVTAFQFLRVAQGLGDEFDFGGVTFGAEGPNQKPVNNVSRTFVFDQEGSVFFDFNDNPAIEVSKLKVWEIAFQVNEIDNVPPKGFIPLDFTIADSGTGIPTRGHLYSKADLEIEVR